MKKQIILIAGPTGSGKTTITNNVYDRFRYGKHNNVKLIIPYTTRKRRTEKEDMEYIFISNSEFYNMVNNNKFINYNSYSAINTDGSSTLLQYGLPDIDINVDRNIYHGIPSNEKDAFNIASTLYTKYHESHDIYVFRLVTSPNLLALRIAQRVNNNEMTVVEALRKSISDARTYNNNNILIHNDNTLKIYDIDNNLYDPTTHNNQYNKLACLSKVSLDIYDKLCMECIKEVEV